MLRDYNPAYMQFSDKLRKLFIDMNKPVQAMFRVGANPPEGLFIRALPLYAVAGHIQQPVTRCPNHASAEDSSNRGFPEVNKPVFSQNRQNHIKYI